MTFLKTDRTKQTFEDRLAKKAPGTRELYKIAFKNFEKFCSEQYSRSTDEVITEFTLVDEQAVYDTIQDWIDWNISENKGSATIRMWFSCINNYLRYKGIKIEAKENIDFPKLTERGHHGDLVRNTFREYTIINLVNFIKIRRDLVKHEDFRKLDDVLKPLVDPILEHQDPIFQIRNQYVAHIQEDGRKFEKMINDIILEHNFPTNFGFYRYLAGLVFFYCGVVERNFKEVWDSALEKHGSNL